MSKWTQCMDMHSGGGQKEDFAYLYIEAPEREARAIFYNRFGHSPDRVSCTCCGEDYSLTESDSLEDATAYNRDLRYVDDVRGRDGLYRGEGWVPGFHLEPGQPIPEGRSVRQSYRGGEGVTLETYLSTKGVKVIRASEITPDERQGDAPEQGYVWRD